MDSNRKVQQTPAAMTAKWIYDWLNQKEYIEITDVNGKITKKGWDQATDTEKNAADETQKKINEIRRKQREEKLRKLLEPVYYRLY